jgi:signal transduction histidine kinase
MIRQPSVLVLGYIVGLIVACAALASLTKVSLEMEASDLESRQEAALEENVRLALWRIDSDMAALIGRESSWPYYAYSKAYSVGGTTVDAATPPQARITSPLADFNGNWVLARFQIAPDGTVSSPQVGKSVMVDDEIRSVESLLQDLHDPDVRSVLASALPDPDVPTLEAVSRVTRTLKSRGSVPPPSASAAREDPSLQVKRNSAEFDTRLRFYSGSTTVPRFEATRNLIQGFVSGWSNRYSPGGIANWWSPPAAQLELRSTPLLSSLIAAQTDNTASYGPSQEDIAGRYGSDSQITFSGHPDAYASVYSPRSGGENRVAGVYAPQTSGNMTLNSNAQPVQAWPMVGGNQSLTVNIDGQAVQVTRPGTINAAGNASAQSLPTSQLFTMTGNANSGQLAFNPANDYSQQGQLFSRGGPVIEQSTALNSGAIEDVRATWNGGNLASLQNGAIVSQSASNPTVVNFNGSTIIQSNAGTQVSPLLGNVDTRQQAADVPYGFVNNGLPTQLRAGSQLELANPPGQRLFNDNNLALQTEVVKVSSVTGVMAPVWSGGALWLARKVDIDGMPYLQGCRLDWRGLQRYLQGLTADLLPEVRFEAIVGETTVDAGRLLASIPARIVPGPPAGEAIKARTSMRTTLAWAWGGLFTAAAAVGLTLWKVTALSERRASFVSSVTHELRTPLTTFRLYGEMLASNMVSDPGQRQEYLETMCAESERLSHLVENVLAYSRLERGHLRGNASEMSPAEVIGRGEARLRRRAEQAGMTFDVKIADTAQDAHLVTDPSAVEQILFNLVDNAGKYAVGRGPRKVELFADADTRNVKFGVRDNGPGIGRAERKRLFRPFSKGAQEAAESAPGVGLGLALCRRLARELGGDLTYEPGGVGATFVLSLPRCG